MDVSELPEKEFSVLVTILLEVLARGAGDHRRAHFHVDVEGAENLDKPAVTRGGVLASIDPDAKEPFVGADPRIRKATRDLLKTAERNRPLYLVQLNCVREGAGWRMQPKIQSVAEYRLLCEARRPLEEALVPLLISAVTPVVPDWREISWNLGFAPMSEEKVELFASVKELQPRPIAIPDFLRAKVEEFRDFYRTNGFELQLMKFQVLGGPKKKAREVEVWYV